MVLTVRAGALPQHAGQVSLPGGAVKPAETVEQAALRKASEEIGLDPTQVRRHADAVAHPGQRLRPAPSRGRGRFSAALPCFQHGGRLDLGGYGGRARGRLPASP